MAGRVPLPGDPGYDAECLTFSLLTPLNTSHGGGAASAADVQAAGPGSDVRTVSFLERTEAIPRPLTASRCQAR